MLEKILRVIPRNIYLIVLLAAAGILLVRVVFPYTSPFVIAIFVAAIIDPLVNFIERRGRIHRGLAVFLVLGTLFTAVVLAGTGLLLRAIAELQEATYSPDRLPLLDTAAFEGWLQSYRAIQEYVPPNLADVVEQSIQDINGFIINTARGLLSFVANLVKNIPQILLYVLVTFLATFFMSKDKKRIEAGVLGLIPAHRHDRLIRIRDGVLAGAMGYLRAQLIIVIVTTVIATASFIYLNVRYIWLWSLIIFVLDFIPLIGPSLVLLPWAGWALFNQQIDMAVVFVLTYGLIAVTRQILEPKLIGDRIGIHPLLTLFSVFVGVRVLGVVGIIAAPLLVITIKAILFSADDMIRPDEPTRSS